MKTEAQLARTEMELRAIDDALSMMRYLRFSPKNGDTWKRHCEELNWKLFAALREGEFWLRYPDHKFG